MKKVLVICYYWPPASGPGVQRFLKMTKYFQEFGWKPYILTSKDGTYPVLDPSLEEEVGEELSVHRTVPREYFSIYNKLMGRKGKDVSVGFIGMDQKKPLQKLAMYLRANYFIPDARKGWNKTAIPKALELYDKERFDAIITTGPPQSSHLIGLELKKRTGVKWLVDLRDPWVNVYYNKTFPRTNSTIQKDQRLENEVLRYADAVTVVSPGLRKEFENRAAKIAIVYNGYEETDMKVGVNKDSEKFMISYIGNFKPNQNVPVFWKVLAEICKNDHKMKAKLRISLTGNIHPEVIASVKDHGLENNLTLKDFVSHKEAIQQMKSSDLLLFIIPNTDGNEKILTGKLFEYMASETPMISIGPEQGDAAKILFECGRMPMVSHEDHDSMKEMISARQENIVNEEHKKYSRKEQARRMISLLER